MDHTKNWWTTAIIGICLAGCGHTHDQRADEQTGPSAKVILSPALGSEVRGEVIFTTVQDGVKIVANVEGLSPGLHGFHIHEYGDCSAYDASSAGDHYDLNHAKHGDADDTERHTGDLGNLSADKNGYAHYERIDKVISVTGPESIVGKSVIVHEKRDDRKSQPSGDSGKRIACGVIEALD